MCRELEDRDGLGGRGSTWETLAWWRAVSLLEEHPALGTGWDGMETSPLMGRGTCPCKVLVAEGSQVFGVGHVSLLRVLSLDFPLPVWCCPLGI